MSCQRVEGGEDFDEVCFFKVANTGRVAGAAPVVLVQLESKSHDRAVLDGYLAPVNAFGSLTAD